MVYWKVENSYCGKLTVWNLWGVHGCWFGNGIGNDPCPPLPPMYDYRYGIHGPKSTYLGNACNGMAFVKKL